MKKASCMQYHVWQRSGFEFLIYMSDLGHLAS